jgi:hypothetical protein
MTDIIETGRLIGPKFFSDLCAAGCDEVRVGWRSDGVLTFDDGVLQADKDAVLAVVAAHEANAPAAVAAAVVAAGGDPDTQSLPIIDDHVGAVRNYKGRALDWIVGTLDDTTPLQIPGGTTWYLGPQGHNLAFNANEFQVHRWIGLGRALRLRVLVAGTQPASGALTVRLRRGESDTNLTVVVPAGYTTGVDEALVVGDLGQGDDSVPFASPFRFAVQYVNAASTASIAVIGHAITVLRDEE